ncbi:MAG: YfiR family protein [Polyangiaceae bacterium]
MFLTLTSDRGRAEEAVLPIAIQVELLVKVASYDRNFQQRAGDRAKVLILTKPGNGDSSRVAAQVEAGLGRVGEIAGLPHEETVMPYRGAPELANAIREKHAAIVFFPPGFRDDIAAIRDALDGVDVLTASAIPEYVQAGVVLGFDVASGRPELLVNLPQAKRQKVALRADVLRLMKVFQ